MNLRKIFFLFCVFAYSVSFSQINSSVPDAGSVSDKQLEEFVYEAKSRGLTESDIETLAKTKGYSNLEIEKLKSRIYELEETNVLDNATVREQNAEANERAVAEINVSPEAQEENNVFGSALFSNKKVVFEPNINIPTPQNYILGVNDQLSVDITGFAYQHYNLTVSPEGTVKVENLSPIFISGLTVEEAKKKITERLKTLFGGLRNNSLSLDLTLSKIRSIKVNVIGSVASPGSYTVSPFSTVFNILYSAGGPTSKGSYRDIQVLRNNSIVDNVDLYPFLTKGTISQNLLKDQDIIFVPVAKKKVTLKGELRTEGVFELKENENLNDLIGFSGGFNDIAYKKSLNIIRFNDTQKELLTVPEPEFSRMYLINGDVVEVGGLIDRFNNQVEIQGAVFRSGRYALSDKVVTIHDLIKLAGGLREDAYKKVVLLKRKNEVLDEKLIQLDLNKPESLFEKLQNKDIVEIKSVTELREEKHVVISGAINLPGEYAFAENMTISDLVFLASGFKEGASLSNIEISSRVENENEVVEVLISKDDFSNNTTLKPFDEIFVRYKENFQNQKKAFIGGMVKFPGIYVINNKNESVLSLIERAGGVNADAYLKGARFYRNNSLVALDFSKLKSEMIKNLTLDEGDSLYIPKKDDVVTISGQYLNNTSVVYSPDLKFTDYISRAGGFTDSAFKKKTYVVYANGISGTTKSFLGIRKYPKTERGMTIVTPVKHREKLSKGEVISLSASLTSLLVVLLTLIRAL